MIHQNNLQVGGIITFWTVGEFSDLATLQDGLAAIGLGDFAPEPRTPPAALRDALGEVFQGRDFLVQPLRDRNGFEVRRVERGEYENTYNKTLTAKLKDRTLYLDPFGDKQAELITSTYNKHLGKIRGPMVTRVMVEIMSAKLGGTRLRPTGGIYWLPDDHEHS